MGLYTDIVGLIGSGYATNHILNDGTEIPINFSSDSVQSLSSVRDLLPVTLDINDADIELTDGSFTSCYGSEAELTFMLLTDQGGSYWVHCFEYEDLSGYNAGVALQTPPVEVRA